MLTLTVQNCTREFLSPNQLARERSTLLSGYPKADLPHRRWLWPPGGANDGSCTWQRPTLLPDWLCSYKH